MKKILLLICLAWSLPQIPFAQKSGQPRIDSLLADLPKVKMDTSKARLLIDLSFTYNTINPDEGIKYGKEGLALSESLKYKEGEADAYRALGVNYGFGKSDFPESLSNFSKSLEVIEETGNKTDGAKVYNNMGVIYWYLSDFQKALDYYFKALHIHEAMNNKIEMANSLANVGIVYNSQKDYPKALEYMLKGNELDEALGNKPGIASNYGNIGEIYKRMGDATKALQYDSTALTLYETLGDKNGIARNLGNMGTIYAERGAYTKALDHYKRALAIHRELGLQIGIAANQSAIGSMYLKMVQEETPLLKSMFGGDKMIALKEAKALTDSAIVISKEVEDISALFSHYLTLSEIQALMGDSKGALKSYQQYTVFKDSVFTLEKDKKLTETAMQYEYDKKEAVTQAAQEQKDSKQRLIRNSIAGGLIGALLFLIVVYRQRNRISKEKKISDAEKQRSDELLLNILPGEVAEELKTTGTAKAKSFTMVTVMLTDFKDFTNISEKVSAELLVAEIHHCFSAFDAITHKHNIEKIKTIGDAYLCASGLPVSNYTHATDIVQAAIEIRDFMAKRKVEKEARGEMPFVIRIGIHTGPVVAGIVGVKKYAYDIWGDTVNLAARMEQHGEAGKINISGNTYELVKDKFECTHRGKIEAKHKGMIDMYFAEPLQVT